MNGNSYDHHHHHQNGVARSSGDVYATIPAPYPSVNSSLSRSYTPLSCFGVNYIEHRVSKRDTVAGIAIKYGVEVIRLLYFNLYFCGFWCNFGPVFSCKFD